MSYQDVHNESGRGGLLHEIHMREQDFLKEEARRTPSLFVPPIAVDDAKTLEWIGIANVFGTRPRGHIKLFPEDFIVEEVSAESEIIRVEDGSLFVSDSIPRESAPTMWFELVKMEADTIEVAADLARQIGVDQRRIGVAGIKDKHALTAQRVSIRDVSPEKLGQVSSPHFFLKNVRGGKGALAMGDLAGNQFTIFVRMREGSDESSLRLTLADLREQGFWNFFYLQRFGTPRLISHHLGRTILQGRYEEAIRLSLTVASNRELEWYRRFRRRLAEHWGDWKWILHEIEPVAYSFREEKLMIEHLLRYPGDFAGALATVPEQMRLWVYAYGSFLFNRFLSSLIKRGSDVPLSVPLALSPDPIARDFYGAMLREDAIETFASLRGFPFIQSPRHPIETLKPFDLRAMRVIPEGIALSFFLEKGSYATTALAHIFDLSSGSVAPEGISKNEVDAKELLGTGTLAHLKSCRFKELFEARRTEADALLAEDPL